MKILKTIVIAAVFIQLLAQLTYAVDFSLLTPKMIIRTNTSDVLTESIGMKNPNNISGDITLTPSTGIINIVTLDEEKFVLQPNEERWINFTIHPKNPGNYSGEILVAFTPKNGQGLTLSSQIIVFASGEANNESIVSGEVNVSGQVNVSGGTNESLVSGEAVKSISSPIGILSIAIVVVAIVFIIKLRRGKRK